MKFLHIENVSVNADFSSDNLYRYSMTITHNSNLPKKVCVIMQNPSYANQTEADKSVQFLERLIFEYNLREFHDVGELIIVNQFAKIQTSNFQGLTADIGQRNDKTLEKYIHLADIIVLAWGSTNHYYERQDFVIELIKKHKKNIVYQTKKHPSRCSYKDAIHPYTMLEKKGT